MKHMSTKPIGRLVSALIASSLLLTSSAVFAADFDPASVKESPALAARLPAEIAKRGVITIGSDTSYPPAEFLGGQDGQTPMGIDVDLAKAIAAKLGVKMEFLTAPFDSILPAIGPRYDLGISAFTITKERMKAVTFVSYFNGGSQWAVQKDNPTGFNPENPCGATVGVQTASTAEQVVKKLSDSCVAEGKKAIDITRMPKQTDLITRLINGAVDAVFGGSTNVGYAVKQTDGKLQTIGELTAFSPNGIAVAKDQTEWAQLIADTINALISDGTYQEILDKWGIGKTALKRAEVNPDVKV